MASRRILALHALSLIILLTEQHSLEAQRPDPVINDPVRVDTAYPPATAELAFDSKGSRLNGFFYLANGKGPHPTVILLHGFPGNERNLDLAQVFRRAGMNVLFFDYRGSWGSGGTFSFAHALEDVASAVKYVQTDSSVTAFRVDPRRIALVGHSLGGWLALMGGQTDSTIGCRAALDFWNVGDDGRRMRSDRQLDSAATAYSAWLSAPGGPLDSDGAQALSAEMKEHAELWDPVHEAGAMSSRPFLLISTTANESHVKLVAALRARGKKVTAVQWKTDHGFSDRRVRLARTILGWLHQGCGWSNPGE
jgi:uncharacterized protein